MHFRDNCSGLHCNNQCPEMFTLGELDSDNWPSGLKATIVALVLVVTMLCVIAKGMFFAWLHCLRWKQRNHEEGDKTQEKHVVSTNEHQSLHSQTSEGALASDVPQSQTRSQQTPAVEHTHVCIII